MDEFALINRFFTSLGRHSHGSQADTVIQGIGDDCAVLSVPSGQSLVVSIDTLVEGTHFVAGTDPAQLAWRLLGASVSDLAAMGAEPAWVTLALTLPAADESWLKPFSAALGEGLAYYGINLVGGDTTRGPLSLSAQVHGFVPHGAALLRSGARAGDLVCVSGTLGDSRGGLECILNADIAANDYLLDRFYRPTARVSLGQHMRRYATAAADISDGLLADLQHILTASCVGATVNPDLLPISTQLAAHFDNETAKRWALSGGEDFELCLTIAPECWQVLCEKAPSLAAQLTSIGVVDAELGLRLQTAEGTVSAAAVGFNHFANETRNS